MTDIDVAVHALGGETNKVIYDDIGMPSIMVEISEEIITFDGVQYGKTQHHPAFIVNGETKSKFYVSKYQNVVLNNRAYSLPMQVPKLNINFYDALKACKSKGLGWHLMTNAEWAYLASLGSLPRGNNNSGSDYRGGERGGMKIELSNRLPGDVVFTGSGPISYSHNGESSGIWDLNGNISEWVSGLRLVDGEIQIIKDNDAADFTNLQGDESELWKSVLETGVLAVPFSSASLKFDHNSESMEYPVISNSMLYRQNDGASKSECAFKSLSAREITVPPILRLLGVAPWDGTDDGYIAIKNTGIRPALRGGGSIDAEKAGIRALSFSELGDYSAFGFRSCYVDILDSALLSDERGVALATEDGIIVN